MTNSKTTKQMLKKLFLYSVTDKKIEKVIMDEYGKSYNPEYKRGFYKKYLSHFFCLKKSFHIEDLNDNSILNSIIIFSSFFSLCFSFVNKDINFLIFGLSGLSIFVFIMLSFRMELSCCVKKINDRLNYDKEDLAEKFATNKLKYPHRYLNGEKLNKDQLQEFIRYIKSYYERDFIAQYLLANNKKDITDLSALRLLLVKMESDQVMSETEDNKKKKIKNEKDGMLNIIDRF